MLTQEAIQRMPIVNTCTYNLTQVFDMYYIIIIVANEVKCVHLCVATMKIIVIVAVVDQQ